MKNNIKAKIFFGSLIVNTASIIEKGVFFIASIVIARYLSIEHFAEYSTALAYATFFSTMTDIGINVTLIRALNLESQYEREHFTNAFVLKTCLSIIMYMVMALSLCFTGYTADVTKLTLILGIVRIGNEFMKTYYSVDEAKQQFLYPSLINIVYVVFFLLGIITVILYNGTYYGISIVRLVIVYIFIFILSLRTFTKFSFALNTDLFFKFVKDAIPFSIITILSNITFRINVIILSLIIGTTKVGIFTNSLLFIDTIAILPANLTRITRPVLYKALLQNDKNAFQFAFDIMNKYHGIIAFYLMILLYIFAKDIIGLIFGGKYDMCIPIIQILSFAIPFVFNIATIIIVGLDKQYILSRIMMVATVVNILSNIILIKVFDIHGAAISVIITYGLIFLLAYAYLYKSERLNFNAIVVSYTVLIAISFFVFFAYYSTIIKDIKFYYSVPLVSLIYFALILVFLIKNDDIRIMKEMLGFKNVC